MLRNQANSNAKIVLFIINFDGVNTFNCGSGKFTQNLFAGAKTFNLNNPQNESQIVPFLISGNYDPTFSDYKPELLAEQRAYCESKGGKVILLDLPDPMDQFGNIVQWRKLCRDGAQAIVHELEQVNFEVTKVIVIANDTAYSHIPIELSKAINEKTFPFEIKSMWIPHSSSISISGKDENNQPIDLVRFEWEQEAVLNANLYHYEILPIGEHMRNHLEVEYGLDANDIREFRSGINRQEYLTEYPQAEIDLYLKNLEIPLTKPLLFSIGRGVKAKGHDLAIKAFAKIAEENQDIHLVILAPESFEKDHTPDLIKLIQELKLEERITLLTHFDKKLAQYMYRHQHTLATVLLVRESPEDLIPMEARTNPNRAVLLVSNRGSNVFQVSHGRDGLIADIGSSDDENVSDVVKQLEFIIAMPETERVEMVAAGKQKIANRYDSNRNFVDNYLSTSPLKHTLPSLMSVKKWQTLSKYSNEHPLTKQLMRVQDTITFQDLINELYVLLNLLKDNKNNIERILHEQVVSMLSYLLDVNNENDLHNKRSEQEDLKNNDSKELLNRVKQKVAHLVAERKINLLTVEGDATDKKNLHTRLTDQAEREKYRAIIHNGLFYEIERTGTAENKSIQLQFFDTQQHQTFFDDHRGIYVISMQGDIYIGSAGREGETPFYHSSFIDGGIPVRFAGLIEIEKGRLKYFDNCSGHFKPSERNVIHALRYLHNLHVIHHDTKFYMIDTANPPEEGKGFSLVPRNISQYQERDIDEADADLATLRESIAKDFLKYKLIYFVDHKLTSGDSTPIYIDMRLLSSYPHLLRKVARLYAEVVKSIEHDKICGVPVGAQPVATAIAASTSDSIVVMHKSPVNNKMIDGSFEPGQNCLMIEDITTTGGSVLAATQQVRAVGLVVTDAIVFIDTERGAGQNVAKENVRLHTIFKFSDFLDLLDKTCELTKEEKEAIVATKKTMIAEETEPNKLVKQKNQNNTVSSKTLKVSLLFKKQSEKAIAIQLIKMLVDEKLLSQKMNKDGIDFSLNLYPLISNPKSLENFTLLFAAQIKKLKYDKICGLSPAGQFIVTNLALITKNHSAIILRDQRKEHGCGKLIEGEFNLNQSCLVIIDAIEDHKKLKIALRKLTDNGLKVKDIVVLVEPSDRVVKKLNDSGYNLHFVFTKGFIQQQLTSLNDPNFVLQTTTARRYP